LPAAITPNIIQSSRSQTLILIVAHLSSRSPRYKIGPIVHALALNHPSLLAFALSVARLSVWLVLLTAIFAPLERLFALRP